MSRKTQRAGAVATVLTMIVTLFAVQSSSAAAQSEDFFTPFAVVEAVIADDDSLPQFVSEPVVQPLPQGGDVEADSLHQLVAVLPDDEDMSRDLRCLAQAIYHEARGEPLAGQLAVARVIVNRTQSPLFPDNYCSVVVQPAQFSFVRKGRIPAVPTQSGAWQRAKAIARIAHQELWESEVQDALFFHATYVRPSWARSKLARATIDNHVFYR